MENGGGFLSSELLVNVSGIIHELAACEVFTVPENLLQLQLTVLVLVGNGDHLLGLVQSVVLVHRVHVLLGSGPNIRGDRSVLHLNKDQSSL